MILEAVLKGNTMVELPPLSLYSMTKPQLEEFIPRLINLACATSPPTTPSPPSAAFCKPEWWPNDVPWITPQVEDRENLCKKFAGGDMESTDKMRSVVRACYEFMGHKELLNKTNTNMDAGLACLKANTDVMAVESSDDDSEPEVVDVYVCFYCDHWFGGKEGKSKLEEHVLTHMDTIPSISDPTSSCPQLPASSVNQVPKPAPSLKSKPLEIKPRPFLPRPPKRRPEIPLWKRSDLPCNNGVSENEFLKSFGLISSKQAKTAASKSKSEMDIDCEIVAVEGLDSRPLTSPRTPRSLMSQLSRDGEGSSRKRLSFSLPDDASDGENTEASPSKNIQGALLNVPFSSLLGKRIKKHIKPDSSACTIKDPEEHCCSEFRNEFLDKLRFRVNDYPVTYKKKRKHSSKFTHEYKFNRDQTREFLKRVRTGLNKESRQLKRRLMKCKIVLKRLSKEEINFWKEKRNSRGAEWIDDDISIVHIEPPPAIVDRSRLYHASTSGIVRPMRPNPMQTPGHNPSILQARSPYLMQHLVSRQPQQCNSRVPKSVPQFLVKKVEKQFNGHQSSKLVYVPISELQKTEPQKRIEPRWRPHQGSPHGQTLKTWGEHTMVADRRKLVEQNSSRRKQHFVNVRRELDHDSDVSIHSQSSDDDATTGSHGSKPSSKVPVSKPQGMVAVNPQRHMVMSATGEFVKTVGQKARKSFGGGSSLVSAQALRHFTSHPVKKNNSPNRWSVSPKIEASRHVLGTPASNSSVKPMYQSDSAKMRNSVSRNVHNIAKASSPVKPLGNVLQPQPVLRVVDDVIYIDDDD